MREMIRLLLEGKEEQVESLYEAYRFKVQHHQFEISRLAKTETLGESPASYRLKVGQGKRNPGAAFEIALRSGHDFRAGDQVSYYMTGHDKGVIAYVHCRSMAEYDPAHPDENVAYYLDKLRQLKKKFTRFLPGEKSLFD
jgi:hypothetical protein